MAALGSSPRAPHAELAPGCSEEAPWAGPAALGTRPPPLHLREQVPAALSPRSATMEAQAQGEWSPIAPGPAPRRAERRFSCTPNFSDRAGRGQPHGSATLRPPASAG